MNLIFLQVETGSSDLISIDILKSFANGGVNIMDSKKHSLKLSVGGKLSETNRSILWKGTEYRLNQIFDNFIHG